MNLTQLTERLHRAEPELFRGPSASSSLGWLRSPARYLGDWLDELAERLPRRHSRSILLGMGGSSSPARFFAEASGSSALAVLDTSNPDTVAQTDFSGATVLASSKSGTTVETQTLLAHALAHGLDPRDLVVITDPGTSLAELGATLGATVIEGDPHTGGRFSALTPFGLVPALYAGWSPSSLRDELGEVALNEAVVVGALEQVDRFVPGPDPSLLWDTLRQDPALSGGALWLEQLLAETTGKSGRGVVPLAGAEGHYRPAEIFTFHLAAVLAARELDVDPFDQPDVDSAKRAVFDLLRAGVPEIEEDRGDLLRLSEAATYRALQVYAPVALSAQVAQLREGVSRRFGPTTANLGPRYLHSTGQLHKGGPAGVLGIQIVVRPSSMPQRIQGRAYSFHDLHRAQALSDQMAMRQRNRQVRVLVVDALDEAAEVLEVAP